MRLIIALFFLITNGCVTVHNVTNSSIESKTSDENTSLIFAEDIGDGVFHLTEPVLHVNDKLKSQCKGGSVHGIQTKLASRDFFIIQRYNLSAVGYCTKR